MWNIGKYSINIVKYCKILWNIPKYREVSWNIPKYYKVLAKYREVSFGKYGEKLLNMGCIGKYWCTRHVHAQETSFLIQSILQYPLVCVVISPFTLLNLLHELIVDQSKSSSQCSVLPSINQWMTERTGGNRPDYSFRNFRWSYVEEFWFSSAHFSCSSCEHYRHHTHDSCDIANSDMDDYKENDGHLVEATGGGSEAIPVSPSKAALLQELKAEEEERLLRVAW